MQKRVNLLLLLIWDYWELLPELALDIDGRFELIIPYRYVTYKVKISARGICTIGNEIL